MSITTIDLEPTIKFAKYLAEIGKPIWVRHVLVPGITDKDELLEKLADFIVTLGNVEKVEILPYHNLGEYKWDEMGLDYELKDMEPPSKERVENAKKIIGSRGLSVR